MFKYLVGLVALIVASCAAFFSVQGLATLYAGEFLAVCIMASSLEVGKLVSASYLHRYWDKTSTLLRVYLVCAVISLMGITSMGIYGFLSSAYQENSSKMELVESKEDTTQSKKEFLEKEITSLNQRVATLNSARTEQEKRLPSLSSKAAKPIYDDIVRAGEEIKTLRSRIDELTNQLFKSSDDIVELKSEKKEIADIGTLQFVAKSFNVPVQDVVKWFTILIVLVFDPLAVSLVLAYNNIVNNKESVLIIEAEEPKSEIVQRKIVVSDEGVSGAKYRD